MDAGEERQAGFVEGAGDDLVGEEHVFLDELVAFVVGDEFEAVGVAVGIGENFDFGEIEIEAAFGHAGDAQRLGEGPERADGVAQFDEFGVGEGGEGAAGRAGGVGGRQGQGAEDGEVVFLEEGEGLAVGEALAAADDGVGEAGGADFAAGGEGDVDALDEAILRFDEAAQAVRERVREHRDDAADEVGGVAAGAGLAVEGGAGADVGAHVGDVDADAQFAGGEALDGEGVVEVLGVVGVNGEGVDVAGVFAAGAVAGADFGGDGVGFGLNDFGEFGLEVEFVEDGLEFRAGRVGAAEVLDDFAGGVEVPLRPLLEADEDFVAGLGRGEDGGLGGVGDENGSDEAGVVGGDVPELVVAAEGAGDGFVFAFEDADDAADFGGGAGARAGFDEPGAGAFVLAHQDAVAVEGGAGIFGEDVPGFAGGRAAGGIGEEDGRAALAEFNRAALEVGVAGDDEAVLLDLGDEALVEQVVDEGAEFFRVAFVEREVGGDFVKAQGGVVLVPEEFQQAVFETGGGRAGLVRGIHYGD